MTVLWSLLAATSWGAGDFFGGVAARSGRVTAVAAASQAVGIAVVLVLAPLIGGSPSGPDMGWGALAGVSGGLGILMLYRGMAVAHLGLVAPVAAIGTAAFPLLFGIATGERPGALEIAGLVVGLAAIWLVSSGQGPTTAAGLLYGLAAGAAFGGLLIGLSRIGDDSGIWPLAPTRLAGALIIVAIALASRQALVPVRAAWRAIVPAGSLGVLGNVFFVFAVQDSLAVAAVIGSLFPAATVILARLVLHEPLTRRRAAGVLAAAVAVGLLALG